MPPRPVPPPFLLGWLLIQLIQQQQEQLQAPPSRLESSSCSACGGSSSYSVSGKRCGCATCVLDACLVLWRCSSVMVLKSALDYLGLGASTGALNPLDVLVIGCQDCLQLLLEGNRLHFGIIKSTLPHSLGEAGREDFFYKYPCQPCLEIKSEDCCD